MMEVFLPVYLPNIGFVARCMLYREIECSFATLYQKQTYCNRTEIYAANGKLKLIVPVKKMKSEKKYYHQTRICNDTNWQKNHWISLCSAYRSTPYFEYYERSVAEFYTTKPTYLFHFNLKLMAKLFALLGLKTKLKSHHCAKKSTAKLDLFSILPNSDDCFPRYYQIFSHKHGFMPNLSLVDLLFHQGPQSLNYLQSVCEKWRKQNQTLLACAT